MTSAALVAQSPQEEASQTGAVSSDQPADELLAFKMDALIAVAQVDAEGDVYLTSSVSPRFLEPKSGAYWQITAPGKPPLTSRSLWDRTLPSFKARKADRLEFTELDGFDGEPVRLATRIVVLPGSAVRWRFTVARAVTRASTNSAD